MSEVTTREELRGRAREIALSIAGRNPKAIQGTVRAIWEALDMTRSMALQNGMAYTHIGNQGGAAAMGEKRETTYR